MSWDGGKNCCCDEGTGGTDSQTLSTTEVAGVTTEVSISNGNTVAINHPGVTPTLVNVTEVLRTRLNINPDSAVNANAAPKAFSVTATSLNEIGVTTGGSNFTLPAGNYEIEFTSNFDMQSGTPRVNFNFQLRQGAVVLDEAYGGVYMRNQNGHDEAGNTHLFELQTAGGTFNIASVREASNGTTDLDGGWIIIRRYEQKQVVATVTL